VEFACFRGQGAVWLGLGEGGYGVAAVVGADDLGEVGVERSFLEAAPRSRSATTNPDRVRSSA